jgi:hypothetical protein
MPPIGEHPRFDRETGVVGVAPVEGVLRPDV